MNAIDFDVSPSYIRDYLEQKFDNNFKLSSNGRELMVPSIFTDDRKNKLSINLDTGLWQCFKSKETGNFFKLMSILEGVSYSQARTKSLVRSFSYGNPKKSTKVHSISLGVEKEFEGVKVQDAVDHSNGFQYLQDRGLFERASRERWVVCKNGRYKDRLIIPYLKDDEIIFFQARTLVKDFPKYLTPPSEKYIKSSSILFPFNWDEKYVVVCEGPIDAISLQEMGINATSIQGSFCSTVQLEQLREFGGTIIVGFDNDEAGNEGTEKMNTLRKSLRLDPFYRIIPPDEGRDWNTYLPNKELGVDYLEEAYPYTVIELLDIALRNFES